MRLDINLASRPYEDARQFWMVWGTAVGVVAALTLLLLTLDVSGWVFARRDRHEMQQKRAMIADLDRKRAEAEAFLNRAENRDTRDKSQFLNGLIERKGFSWTRVLENLEKVMPPHVHLVAISPGLTEDNELLLKMIVAGDSRDRAIELERRMEESGRFTQTYIPTERTIQSQTGDTQQAEITAIYVPELWSGVQAAPAKNAGSKDANGKENAEGKSAAKPGGASKVKPNTQTKPSAKPSAQSGPKVESAAQRVQ
jgi:type IV pilus assembly protein PilN